MKVLKFLKLIKIMDEAQLRNELHLQIFFDKSENFVNSYNLIVFMLIKIILFILLKKVIMFLGGKKTVTARLKVFFNLL